MSFPINCIPIRGHGDWAVERPVCACEQHPVRLEFARSYERYNTCLPARDYVDALGILWKFVETAEPPRAAKPHIYDKPPLL